MHRRQKKMETFAFLKGPTQMRLFHCVWISSLVILGLLLTSTNLSNKDVSKTLKTRNVGKTPIDAVRAAGEISDVQSDWDMWPSNTSSKVNYRAWDSNGGCKAFRKKHPLEIRRQKGEPWRVFMDLEPARKKAESQDLFVSYHAEDDLQVTYAGASFHMIRNYYISPFKHNDVLVYWSSSRCVDERQRIASELLPLLSHHSFGKCLNNVGGRDKILDMYPKCSQGSGSGSVWGQNLHCAMSHYKFVLAIENTRTESYVTEKLYYALDVGAVPIYFGAPNVRDFVPPNSFIDGYQFQNMKELADYVNKVAADPLLYAEYHGWRRCGVMGNYGLARAISLDSMPCRLCTKISQLGGRQA